VFGNPEEVQPTDMALSGWMMDYWTNFAKTGDPNGPGLAPWPRFVNSAPQTMVLTGDGCHAAPVPSEPALKVLDEYFAWRRSQE
jgi:para-nitrobenzyl esterase